jgi:hypothetical protein
MGIRKHRVVRFLTEEGHAGAARRQMQRNIEAELQARIRNCFNDNEEIEQIALASWDISDHFLRNKRKELKQTIRNALKYQRSDGEDLLTRGLLIALVDGGACLPGHIPKGRVAKVMPRTSLGIDPPRIPVAKEKTKPKPVTKKRKHVPSGAITPRKIAESYVTHIEDAHHNANAVFIALRNQIIDMGLPEDA